MIKHNWPRFDDPREESLPLTPEQLDELTTKAVKGFDSTLEPAFRDAVSECTRELHSFMEQVEIETDVGKVINAAKRLEAAILEKTKAYIEAEYN